MYTEKVLQCFKNTHYAQEMKDPDAVGEVGNVKCLLPEERIHKNDHLVCIKNISKNDKIISHDGKYHQISQVYSRKCKEKVITIQNKLGKTTLTAEHLVYALKVPKKRKFFDTIVKRTIIPAWYHAEDLEKRDVVLYPVFNEIEDKEYIEPDLSAAKFDFKSKKIPSKIELNADFLRLCGYFIAEGHAIVKPTRNSVRFAFHVNETKYIADVKNITKTVFGLDVFIREEPQNKLAVVIINNVFVAKLFQSLFGSGAKNKRIPHFMMLLPPEKQIALIMGMWRGDGHLTLKRKFPRASYTTISEQLIHQMKTLLLRQKIVPSVYTEEEKMTKGVLHQEAYRIHVGDRNSMIRLMNLLGIDYNYKLEQKDRSWFDQNYFYTPISGLEEKEYQGMVYNLEVPGTHSFATNSLLVHNCGDIMRVYLKIKDNRIVDITYLTYGCVAAIASTEALCKIVKGKTLDEALKLGHKDVIKELESLPAIKIHCSSLSIEALRKAIEDYKQKQPG